MLLSAFSAVRGEYTLTRHASDEIDRQSTWA